MNESRPEELAVPEVGPDEELASAVVDGEATAAESGRAAEPGVARAIAAHAEVARLLAIPVEPPSPAAREAAIAAALGAFDRGETQAGATQDGDELAARRSRRPVRGWLGAVAAAAVILAGVGLLANLVGDDDTPTSTETAVAADTDEADGAPTTAAAPAAPLGSEAGDDAAGEATTGGAGAATGSGIPAYLGDYVDADELFVGVRADPVARQAATREESGFTVAAPGNVAGLPCGAEAGAETDATVLGTATVDGELATVLLEVAPDGSRTIVVLAEPACDATRAPFDP